MTDSSVIELSEKFLNTILVSEPWFKELDSANAIDLIVLTGSMNSPHGNKSSDIDLFVLMSIENQKTYGVFLVREYTFGNRVFELSLVATEKLVNDQFTKRHIYWWADSKIIFGNQELYGSILYRAGSLNESEKRDWLWSNYIHYCVNMHSLENCIKRGNIVSSKLFISECVRLLGEFTLIANDIFVGTNWYDLYLSRVSPELYLQINNAINTSSQTKALSVLEDMKVYFRTILQKNGYSRFEIDNWHQVYAYKFKLQTH